MLLLCASLLFLLAVSSENCKCMAYGQEAYWSGPGGRQNIFEYPPNTNIQEDIKLIREILPDTTEKYQQPEKSQFLQDTVNMEYATVILNLARENQVSFNVKIAAIRRALESAFTSDTGVVDAANVDMIINMIKKDVDQKRKLIYGPYAMPYNLK